MKGTLFFIELDAEYSSYSIEKLDLRISPKVYLNTGTSLQINKIEYTPQIGDKVYFLPGVNIPRVKLKDLNVNYNIKVVRDPAEADVVFGSDSSFNKMSDNSWKYRVKTEYFRMFLTACAPHMDSVSHNVLSAQLDTYTESVVVMNHGSLSVMRDGNFPAYKNLVHNVAYLINNAYESDRMLTLIGDYSEVYKKIQNKPIIHERGLLDKLNGDDAIVINQEVFDQISNMFASSDQDNHVLAMEIMANCNYAESLMYLEMIFHDHYHTMRNNNARNHVNFKSLLSYLNKDRNYFSTNVDQMLMSLYNKQVLTTEMLDIILTKYKDEVDRGTSLVRVKTLTVSEELLEFVNSNYIYEIKPDFVPEVLEEPEVTEPVAQEVKWL